MIRHALRQDALFFFFGARLVADPIIAAIEMNPRTLTNEDEPMPPNKVEPLAYSVKDACEASSIGRTRLFALMKSGALSYRKVGRRTLIHADSLRRVVNEGAA